MSAFEISFVIPCYNAGTLLREAIDSIRRQKGRFVVTDIIVIDDRSNDPATRDVLREIAAYDNVRVLTNEGPRGAASARNTGLKHVKGTWIAFMDADDILMENSLEIRCRTAEAFPDCRWITADFRVFYDDGTTEERTFFSSRPLPAQYFAEAFATGKAMRLTRPVPAFIDCCLSKIGANLFHRDLIAQVAPFDTDLFMSEDHQWYIRLANVSDMIFVPEPVLLYRRHSTNTTNADVPPGMWPIRALEQLLSKYHMTEQRAVIRRKISLYHLWNVYYFRKKGAAKAAIQESMAALACTPGSGEAWRCLVASILAR